MAEAVLLGEILYYRGAGHHEEAFNQLRKAVHLDDSLPYDEPWGWMMPARHPLGALLLEAGHVEAAMAVYREDLGPGKHPKTIWSLTGLKQCLEEARRLRALLEEEERELVSVCAQIEEATQDGEGMVAASCACAKRRWG